MTPAIRAIRLHDVHKRYGRRDVLAGISLDVAAGGRLGVIGPAASGKTVIATADGKVYRVVRTGPHKGARHVIARVVVVCPTDHLRLQWAEAADRMGIVLDLLSVAENVAFPLEQRGDLEPPAIAARVAERLRAVGLAGSEHKRTAELSGGMKKRVGIARATVADAELVIYDEPTAGLDPVTTQKIYDLLSADQARTGATVLAISSDVTGLTRFVDEIAFLYRGHILYRGPAATIADAPDPIVRQFVRGELDGPLDDQRGG